MSPKLPRVHMMSESWAADIDHIHFHFVTSFLDRVFHHPVQRVVYSYRCEWSFVVYVQATIFFIRYVKTWLLGSMGVVNVCIVVWMDVYVYRDYTGLTLQSM